MSDVIDVVDLSNLTKTHDLTKMYNTHTRAPWFMGSAAQSKHLPMGFFDDDFDTLAGIPICRVKLSFLAENAPYPVVHFHALDKRDICPNALIYKNLFPAPLVAKIIYNPGTGPLYMSWRVPKAIKDNDQPETKTATARALAVVEIWMNIFEQLEPEDFVYARQAVADEFAQNTPSSRENSDIVGDQIYKTVLYLLPFEKKAWRYTRTFYAIDHVSRKAALKVGLSALMLQRAKQPLAYLHDDTLAVDYTPIGPGPKDKDVIIWELFNEKHIEELFKFRKDLAERKVICRQPDSIENYRWFSCPCVEGTMLEILQEAVFKLENLPWILLGASKIILLIKWPNGVDSRLIRLPLDDIVFSIMSHLWQIYPNGVTTEIEIWD